MFKIFSKGILVKNIQAGKQLKRAEARPVQDFVAHWLQNKVRKALVGNWLVLYEDQAQVYWGKPHFRSLFSSARVVDQLFKTPKTELLEKLPAYKKEINRLQINRELQEALVRYYEQLDGVHIHDYKLMPNSKIEFRNEEVLLVKTAKVNYTSAPYQPVPETRRAEREDRFIVHIDNSTGKIKKIQTPH